MNLKCCFETMLLVFFALPYSLKGQLYTTGYAYQVVSGSQEGIALSHELIHVHHNCWIDDSCKYVAILKMTKMYIMLKSMEESGNERYSVMWKKDLKV